MAQQVKNPLAMQETQELRVRFLGQEDPWEKGMVTYSSILVWEIPWIEEPGGLQSVGSQRVGHDLASILEDLTLSLISYVTLTNSKGIVRIK